MTNPFGDLKMPQNKDDGLTFDQWKRDGYSVQRGEKATGRNGDGVPTFTHDQVQDSNWDVGGNDGDGDHPSLDGYPPQHYLPKGFN